MEDLPAEMTVDILSRLPVKKVVQCKCVCKKWRNLVLDSYFVNRHLSRSPGGLIVHHRSKVNVGTNPGILKLVEIEDNVDHHRLHHDPAMSLDLNLAPSLQKSRIFPLLGSVNGLICLWQRYIKIDNMARNDEVDNTYICNPITREYLILPKREYFKRSYGKIFYGFGVSSQNREYKVVRTFLGEKPRVPSSSSRPRLLEVEVYTLGTGQWRSLGHIPYWFSGFYVPFLNGHLHWILGDQYDVPAGICSFDLDKETFQLFPSHPFEAIEDSRIFFQSLGVLKGCLCKYDTYDSQMTVWVMKEYGIKESWHKELVIKTTFISLHVDWQRWERMDLIEGLNDGSILMVYRVDNLVVYCSKSRTFEDTRMFKHWVSALAYCPSFLKLRDFESERVLTF